jgi:hypothetical protein
MGRGASSEDLRCHTGLCSCRRILHHPAICTSIPQSKHRNCSQHLIGTLPHTRKHTTHHAGGGCHASTSTQTQGPVCSKRAAASTHRILHSCVCVRCNQHLHLRACCLVLRRTRPPARAVAWWSCAVMLMQPLPSVASTTTNGRACTQPWWSS